MESLFLLPLLVFILLINLGLVFKIYISYSLFDNLGLVVIKFWAFKVVHISFQIKSNSIIIRTETKKNSIEYSFSDPKLLFYEKFLLQIKDKLKLKTLDLISDIGTLDAHQTAVLCCGVDIVYKVLGAKVKNIKPTATIKISAVPNYKQKVFKFSGFAKMSLSLFDFLYSALFAWFSTK